MQPPTSRRGVPLSSTTLPIQDIHKPHTISYIPSRKYQSVRTPRLIFLFLSTTIFTFLFYILYPTLFPCNHVTAPQTSLKLIPALQQWQNPEFAKSHLRIFVYDLPSRFNTDLVRGSIEKPGQIRDPRCDTNFYSSEVHVHRFLLNSPVRTQNPDEADFFYVPIYTTCDLITHLPNNVPRVGRHFGEAMDIVIQDYPYWNRSTGRDHVYLFSQGFSARLAGNWQRYSNGIFMVHNGEFTAPEYTPHKDFTIPPELRAYFRPYWVEKPDEVEYRTRTYLAQFGGQVISTAVADHRGSNYSGGVRQYIEKFLSGHEEYRITGVRSDTYISDMRNSKFCLAPEGWHPWSPRPYYSVMMGCIPVIISEVQELAFEEFVDWDSFAVWIRPSDIAKLDTVLRSMPEAELRRRRAAMKEVWRALWYSEDGLAYQAILRSLYARKYKSRPKRLFSSSQ